ncbi:ATP-binding cassette domain-containing protein [Neorhizobium sp. S3-V5DH]|uniref:ABC transporter ATP-binding protein n=1 Tax=Neorhizobium sp. S3-V5DH TaxID=2485166 RepID=UPI00104A07FE|nr:ATP-binding cassette domain-containing protein [Neorhizobium sp. S3-V5DH]TCV67247.1 NitT/TauT family transport system ATP-binding protein [Neorhizobium sp. S3-V5DH]
MASSITPAAEPVLRLDLQSGGPGGVLGSIALSLAPGETVALTGPSGIGKTSLLRIIAGLDRSFTGRRRVTARLAMVFQEPVLLPWRTAIENLKVVARISHEEAGRWLEDVGLAGLGDRFPGMLSLGQQRRLSLARAFACAPDLLLMDEPFVSLDPSLASEMMGLLERLIADRPCATLLVTHVRAEAERLAGRILRMEGRPARIVEEDRKVGAFFQLSAAGGTMSRS